LESQSIFKGPGGEKKQCALVWNLKLYIFDILGFLNQMLEQKKAMHPSLDTCITLVWSKQTLFFENIF